MYNQYISGKLIYLRRPTEQDALGRWHEWFSDQETMRYVGNYIWPNSKEKQIEFYNNIDKSNDRMIFSIIDIESEKHIGVCNLSDINWVSRFCGIAVIIGEKPFRKNAYGFECVSLLLRIAFLVLNLRIVKGGYVKSNEQSKYILQVFKFKEVGCYSNLFWIQGKYEDQVLVQLNREDWLKRNPMAASTVITVDKG